MWNTNEWFYFTDGLEKNTCDKIKNSVNDKWDASEIIKYDRSGGEIKYDPKPDNTEEPKSETNPRSAGTKDKNVRISDVAWSSDQWIYDTIWPWMLGANDRAGWKYDIRCAEPMQITRYKKGGYYLFHRDGKSDHPSAYNFPNNEFMHGYVRKLSMSILLNDNYEGGEFEFATYNGTQCTIVTPEEFNKTGSIIVFPSHMEHRVAPVTKGIRYSLVVWFMGPPFK